ncbi:lysophospholipid acyltransferase 5 [Trichonephila clavipes]|nr:lysophospholipid acyltransferase 5 [Trichonephila clavipes]
MTQGGLQEDGDLRLRQLILHLSHSEWLAMAAADAGNGDFIRYFAEILGASEPALRLLFTIFLGYPLALIHRCFLFDKAPVLQHLFFVSCGLSLGFYNYGFDMIHSLICVLAVYLILATIGVKQRLSFTMCCTSIEDALKRDTSLPDLYALQRHIMNNYAKCYWKDKAGAIRTYDVLKSKLLALELLGRTQEKFADFLEPLVESCLPEAVLQAWERCRNAETTSEGQDSGRSLDRLMTFLRKEVESEEMILLARTGLWSTQRQKVKASAEELSLATSAALVNTKGERSGKPRSCLFGLNLITGPLTVSLLKNCR